MEERRKSWEVNVLKCGGCTGVVGTEAEKRSNRSASFTLKFWTTFVKRQYVAFGKNFEN